MHGVKGSRKIWEHDFVYYETDLRNRTSFESIGTTNLWRNLRNLGIISARKMLNKFISATVVIWHRCMIIPCLNHQLVLEAVRLQQYQLLFHLPLYDVVQALKKVRSHDIGLLLFVRLLLFLTYIFNERITISSFPT